MRFRDGEIWDVHKKGWTPAGYDNMGPFNEVRIGPAGRNAADAEARDHDLQYGDEEEDGVTPHLQWVDADEEFLQDLNPTNWKERFAQGVFSVKKAAKNAGLVKDMSGKRKRIEPKKVTRKEKPKAKRIVKPIRETPFTEGEAFRERREERTRRHEENMRTRDAAWETDVGANRVEEQEIEEQEVEATGEVMTVDEENWWESENTQGENFESFDNLQASDQMSEAMDVVDEGATAAARASSGGAGNPVSKETEVSTYPNLSYGLPETHTCILPWTGWLSVAKLKTSGPVQIRIRMNSPADMLDCQTNDSSVGIQKGIYNQPIKEDGTLATAIDIDGVSFPETFTSNSSADTKERPAWRAYFGALYEYYTVLGCEYKITINNPVSNIGASVIVGTQFDSYSDTAGQTGNVMPQTALSQMMTYKNIKWDIIQYSRSEVPNRNNAVISGRYTPGQVKRNIQNDGDVKTWTSTGARDLQGTNTDSWATPTLKDFLTLNFYKAPLGFHATTGCNIQFELKYIVQFKDLRQQARYPNTATTDQDIVQTLNESTTAVGNAYPRWK